MTLAQQRARRPLTALALAALTACAITPLEPDRAARAPVLEGFGSLDWRIQTDNPEAQRLFTQGVLQAYAFNEKEAVRQFKAALAADVRCALCASGVAWQLGPNINAPSRGDLTEARRYAGHALRHAEYSSARALMTLAPSVIDASGSTNRSFGQESPRQRVGAANSE